MDLRGYPKITKDHYYRLAFRGGIDRTIRLTRTASLVLLLITRQEQVLI